MDSNLNDILARTCDPWNANGVASRTHVALDGSNRSWSLRPDHTAAFWSSYCALLEESRVVGSICLAEAATEVMPVIAELSLKYRQDDEVDEPFQEGFVLLLIYCYQQALIKHITLSESHAELICCLLEKDVELEGTNNVFRLRLQFPYCRVNQSVQSSLIRSSVIEMLRRHNALSRFSHQPIGDWDDIISRDAHQRPLPLYGSSPVNHSSFDMTNIYRELPEDVALYDDVDEAGYIVPLTDVFIPANHSHVQLGLLNESTFNMGKALEFWVPLFLSGSYWTQVSTPKAMPPKELPAASMVVSTKNIAYSADIDIVRILLPLVGANRFKHEITVNEIGQALHSAYSGHIDGFNLWVQQLDRNVPLSSDESKLRKLELQTHYYAFRTGPITLRTIAWFAREDNPERYNQWHRKWCSESMEQALSGLHVDVAESLYRHYWLEYACSSIKPSVWYEYRNHRWISTDHGVSLRLQYKARFIGEFEKLRTSLSQGVQNSADDAFKNNTEGDIKRLTQLIARLKTRQFKESVLAEVAESFHRESFVSMLDRNPNTTGHANGVIEVEKDKAVFRPGKPEDFISKTTGIHFPVDYTDEHPRVKELMKFLGQVFTDPTLLHHYLKFSGSVLRGKNSDKMFGVWSGEQGDNAKSTMVKLWEAAFGVYCIKFPTSMVTGKRTASSSPTPELARAKGAHIAFLEEPDDDEPMRKGILKHLTGGDSFFARLLNENGGDLQATFKLILVCNRVPVITNPDRAMKNRTKVFPYDSTWVKDAPTDPAEQYARRLFPMDPFFEDRIPLLAPAFLWKCVQMYSVYIKEGLADPAVVSERTKEYWADSDIYNQFTAESMTMVYKPNTKEVDTTARISLTEVYESFKEWYRLAFPGSKVPDRAIVKNELAARWGRINGTYWYGIALAALPAHLGPPSPGAGNLAYASMAGRRRT